MKKRKYQKKLLRLFDALMQMEDGNYHLRCEIADLKGEPRPEYPAGLADYYKETRV